MLFYIIGLCVIGVLNIISFALYKRDKGLSQTDKMRISEKTLVISALLFGGIGAAIGMYALRHKTKHTKFKIAAPIGLIITLAAPSSTVGL